MEKTGNTIFYVLGNQKNIQNPYKYLNVLYFALSKIHNNAIFPKPKHKNLPKNSQIPPKREKQLANL